ncbi:cytochrome c biogenesis protein CcsA [Reichenbachiella ulvae]|uniref:Cytochrome c biogenesis protein CcsA n=1 Tax=Reichenbachiella ulvae TaxID=2980104 RepID=A0ABT3CXQ4_9BACT|nr:cytochrome c biogenesis protein CcsA [Reichenbachiella ulvae]MCV9388467.1 cytochrome c biogenesis protein CcsA [Reichenbachiella ulvae]
MHYFIGTLGHFLIITAFVSALAAAYGYFQSVNSQDLEDKEYWKKLARWNFIGHGVAAIGVVACLYIIINQGYFEYHYAYSHSSKVLPFYYQVSAFWEGQEGSFLLWIFWDVLLGFVLIKTNKYWEAPVMAIFAVVQAFLLSMILGVVLFNIKIGSSPFILLRDAMDAPIFQSNPDFVPEDGSGLNPLLQNYWMVIHPPTLFLGFATTLIPFAYCIAGLWLGRFKEWIRPALPWSLFSAVVLGVGILMGGYWAYETLNFGGYWNWDPVENAVYVPWLVLIAAIHTMIAFKKSTTALKLSIILATAAFLLIVYSTFLTRSGILGDSSVHSFTDLGLSGQLLIYLLAFLVGTIILIIKSWKHLASDEKEVSTYSREFWIFMGATVLCLMGFQVIIPTSIPVWNAILELVGIESNMAPPVDQVEYYTQYQMWGGVLIALLSGTGQFFWWNKMDKSKLKDALLIPLVLTLILTGAAIIWLEVQNITYILILTTGIYSIVANGKILLDRWKTNINLSGGAIAHIGIAMMLLGILFSSGYSKIVSLNKTGLVWSKEFPDEVNQKNLLLFQNENRQMGEYSLNYKGTRKRVEGYDGYINIHDLRQISETEAVAIIDITKESKTLYQRGDTLTLVTPETSYFEIAYQKGDQSFNLYPTVQINEKMNMTVFSPDIKRKAGFDLYTHVRTFPDPDQETQWSEMEEITTQLNADFFVNDFVARLENVERVLDINGVNLGENDVAVKATIRIQGSDRDYIAEPYYIIQNNQAGLLADVVEDLGVKMTLIQIDPRSNSFTLGVNETQKDWVILEAVEKPMINVLWIGTLIMVIGFIIAISRRYSEFVKMKSKGQEL